MPSAVLDVLDLVHGLREAQRGRDEGRNVRLWPWGRATAWRRVTEVMSMAGISGPQASPKGLRHGFGVAAVQAGIPLNMVQKWLGHAQLSTTAIYADAVGAEAVRRWIAAVGARTAFIEPGSPWENGYIESFNARLRDELLNGEIFYTLKEARVLIESWRRHYNAVRPHSSLGYRPPAPETIIPPSWPPGSATLRRPSSLAEKPAMH